MQLSDYHHMKEVFALFTVCALYVLYNCIYNSTSLYHASLQHEFEYYAAIVMSWLQTELSVCCYLPREQRMKSDCIRACYFLNPVLNTITDVDTFNSNGLKFILACR